MSIRGFGKPNIPQNREAKCRCRAPCAQKHLRVTEASTGTTIPRKPTKEEELRYNRGSRRLLWKISNMRESQKGGTEN